ncbi:MULTISPECIES: Ppx/GppA family phosphatase [Streptomyces]|uniref:Ppx/GppA family phosphatase n=1 Tax=Streptomyces koelreuteriae TaxID=2838015 RepID=A0ABX8FJV3_9ACTN|nr:MULTISPECIES: Ppx/GppA family phosphatase [Streptomyces]QWB21392.1 Ppx/GppA family phosphatase [Streptomyces koelreuteriae]UUA04311.1 Ppx/GppA family phosphatase [Streptomyces koelreuteriae]UUA11936.1 Ppx/GppA family phosphatase [Streptomyces sp. CRCS-T-1]
MRISVVDVGSKTVRLVVADAQDGVPLPVHTSKWRLRLSEQVAPGEPIPEQAVGQLVDAVAEAGRTATRWGAAGPLAFATAVVRNAPNRDEVLHIVRARTGMELCTLPGEVEAELTFLGARRWMGWRSGPLALLDIGGGSLEVAFGRGRLPDFVASLPLGAGRLTHEFFEEEDPPSPELVRALRRRVRHQLRDVAARIRWEGPRTAVATSRTFQQLGRLCGAAPGRHGPFVDRELHRAGLREAITTLSALPASERARLPGISAPRAAQSLAGAVVAHTAMKLTGIRSVTVCPWAIREGVLLRHIEDGPSWWAEVTRRNEEAAPPDPVPLRIAAAAAH